MKVGLQSKSHKLPFARQALLRPATLCSDPRPSCSTKASLRKCRYNRNLLRCRSAGADPDTYVHSYDSDDEDATHLADPEGEEDAGEGLRLGSPLQDASALQELREDASFFERIAYGFAVAVHTLATAPRETWRAVRVTGGAAVALVASPAVARDVAEERLWGEGGEFSGGGGSAAVTRGPRERWREARHDMPEGMWGKIQWMWDQPPVKKIRITISMAQWSVRLPAIMALLATQMGLLASQVSLPMLAPLLLGTGMMLRSIRSNASIIFPRICVLVVLLYVLWFANSVVQSTVVYLRRQGALDARVSGAVITASECCVLLGAMVIVLSMIGVNVSGLLLPAGIALAYAAKDLSHNFVAGFFLFAVQPFKLGDRISVSFSTPAAASSINRSAWFEGVCEKVDLRYTIVKSGSRRLFVPNSSFLTREFMVVDDSDSPKGASKRDLFPVAEDSDGFAPAAVQPGPAGYGPAPSVQRPVWAQVPQQPQQPWTRPPYAPAGQAEQGQPGVADRSRGQDESWPAPAAGPLAGSTTFAQPPAGVQAAPQQPLPEPEPGEGPAGGQPNSNVLEWQRRERRAAAAGSRSDSQNRAAES